MYKIIFLDYSMPDMNGPEVATKIRSMLAKQFAGREMVVNRPFIICNTAYVDEVFKERALSAGMDLFVNKPISNLTLKDILRQVF